MLDPDSVWHMLQVAGGSDGGRTSSLNDFAKHKFHPPAADLGGAKTLPQPFFSPSPPARHSSQVLLCPKPCLAQGEWERSTSFPQKQARLQNILSKTVLQKTSCI